MSAAAPDWLNPDAMDAAMSLGVTPLAVYAAIARLAQGDPPRTQISTIAYVLELRPETVGRVVRRLVNAGALRYTPGHGRKPLATFRPGLKDRLKDRLRDPAILQSPLKDRLKDRLSDPGVTQWPCSTVPDPPPDRLIDDDRSCAQAREETDGPDGNGGAFIADWRRMLDDPAWRPGWRPKNPAGFLMAAAAGCANGEARFIDPVLEWRNAQVHRRSSNGNRPPDLSARVGSTRASAEETARHIERRLQAEGYQHISELPLPAEARQVFERLKGEHRAREAGLAALGEGGE